MREAFSKVCEALDLNCRPEDPVTDLICLKIVEVAASGELDPGRICAKVLEQVKTGPSTDALPPARTQL
jgi:hypothetical protein